MIHPTAVVHPDARVDGAEVGPYAVIGAEVHLAAGVRVGAHAVLEGPTSVGPRTEVGPHAVIGEGPQDLRHDPSVRTTLEIGPDNVFRSHTTAHRGSSGGAGRTRIGRGNLFMVGSHVGHDAVIGDDVVLANQVALGGHVEVGDRAFLGGLAAIHQRVRIGRLAMVAGGAVCTRDVPPFAMVQGDRACFVGLNRVGLARAGVPDEELAALKRAFHALHGGSGPPDERLAGRSGALVVELADFVRASVRGLCGPRKRR